MRKRGSGEGSIATHLPSVRLCIEPSPLPRFRIRSPCLIDRGANTHQPAAITAEPKENVPAVFIARLLVRATEPVVGQGRASRHSRVMFGPVAIRLSSR